MKLFSLKRNDRRLIRPAIYFLLLGLMGLFGPAVFAQDDAGEYAKFGIDNLLLLISGGLVFWMHAGFACVESGLTQSKNTTNILAKNVVIVCLSGFTYWLVGFNLMYPGFAEGSSGIFGFAGFGLTGNYEVVDGALKLDPAYADYTVFTDFFFQAVFAATAATIVSGAVAERIKFSSFVVFAFVFVTFIYTIAGSWKWGGGFLDAMGFYDFAGSTLVHSVGGWGALTGAIILGPRMGKYTPNGIKPIVGHSMPLATLGVLILFLGWFGFNGGSVLAMDSNLVSLVYVTTFLAGCAGGLGAMAAAWVFLKKPDLSMILNGILGGLVGITAGADTIMPPMAILVGLVAGCLVVFAVMFFDRLKVDDPVGAISVHLVCGIWGTLAVGIFSINPEHSLLTQAIGVACYAGFTLVTTTIIWFVIKAVMGLRVSPEEETNGLDIAEHGIEAYPEFKAVG